MSHSFALVIRPNMVKNNGKHKNYWQSMKWAMHPKGPGFFFLGQGGLLIFLDFNCFQCVPSSSKHIPQHVPNNISLYPIFLP
jgi:hypothetical protein